MGHRRLLITGCGGMLGSALYRIFHPLYDTVVATDKVVDQPWLSLLDVRETEALRDAFESVRPDLVLHLAAETDLEFCETDPEAAEATNSMATRRVAELADAHGATLVYISTAGVFDGRSSEPYTESDQPNPIMVYGRTKLEGEVHVRAACDRHVIVRSGWMIGGGLARDRKFVGKVLGQLSEGSRIIHAVTDCWGTPTYADDLVINLQNLLERGEHGTFHMVCHGAATRFDVAGEIVTLCGRADARVVPVESSYFEDEYFAPRPRSEMLCNAALQSLGLDRMRPWRHALRHYLAREFSEMLVS